MADTRPKSKERPRPTAQAFDFFEDDEALVEGLIGNLPQAWRAFTARFDRLIYRCITKVTRRFASVVAAGDIREIHAMFSLSLLANDMHKLRAFDPARGAGFSSWIGMLAMNSAYDYLRTRKREPLMEELTAAAEIAWDVPDPYEITVGRQRAAIAARALKAFSTKDRAFATLYFAEDMDPAEIARRMKISVKTVHSKRHKIQTRLQIVVRSAVRGDNAISAI